MSAEERFGERLMRELPLRQAPEGLWREIEERLEMRPAPAGWRRLAFAGAALAVVGTAVVLLRTPPQSGWRVLPVAGFLRPEIVARWPPAPRRGRCARPVAPG